VANAQGFNVIFCNTDENPVKQELYLDMLLRRRADGVLLVPAESGSARGRAAVQALLAQRVRVVVLDRRIDGVAVDSVRGDSIGGARQLTEHLLALGHRVIGCLSGPENLSVTAERVAGYCQALAAAGVAMEEDLIRYGNFTVESGYTLTGALLRCTPRPSALFAANNFLAIGALRALREAGLRTPDDLSLAVFDDLPASYVAEPFLTVAAQPAYDLGATAAALLLKRIRGTEEQPVVELILPTRLIVRASTQPCAAQNNGY
jgi:LacI family transcriptional regulator